MSIEFQLLMLAGLLLLLVALALRLARRNASDPGRAFLLAILHDLPTSDEEASAHESAPEKADSLASEGAPGSRISDFLA